MQEQWVGGRVGGVSWVRCILTTRQVPLRGWCEGGGLGAILDVNHEYAHKQGYWQFPSQTPYVHCCRERKYCQVDLSREKERWKVWNLKTGITGLSNRVIIPRRKRNIWKPASFHECWHFLSPEELLITHPPHPSKTMTGAELYCVASSVQTKAHGTWVSCDVRRNTKETDGWVSSWTAPYLRQHPDNNKKHRKKEKNSIWFYKFQPRD